MNILSSVGEGSPNQNKIHCQPLTGYVSFCRTAHLTVHYSATKYFVYTGDKQKHIVIFFVRVGRVRGSLWTNGGTFNKKKNKTLRCLVGSVKRGCMENTQSLQFFLLFQPWQHMFSIKTNCMYLPFNTLNGPGRDSHLGASAFGHKCTENYFWQRGTAYSEVGCNGGAGIPTLWFYDSIHTIWCALWEISWAFIIWLMPWNLE